MTAPGLPEVLELVRAVGVAPLDSWHLAALAEMEGWNDDTARRLGYTDLFHLARTLWPHAAMAVQHDTACSPPQRTLQAWLIRGLGDAARGLVFPLPVLLTGWASLTAGVSLWYSPQGHPLALAVASLASLLVTGGFNQAMARCGRFFSTINEHGPARRASLRIFAVGTVTAACVSGCLALIPMVLPGASWLRTTACFHLLFSLLWLTLGLLCAVEREWLFPVAIGVGTLLAWGGQWQAASRAAGLLVAAGFCLIAALLHWKRLCPTGGGYVPLPPLWRQALPAVLYGSLYFAFLFADRLFVWSDPGSLLQHERGLTWAWLALLLPAGLVEFAVRLFAERFYQHPQQYPAADSRRFSADLRHLHKRLQVAVILLALTCSAGLLLLAPDPVSTDPAFQWSLVGYSFLAGALLNLSLLLALNQLWSAVGATAAALGVNLATGTALTVLGVSPALSVLGFGAGSAVLWSLAARAVRQALVRADYLLYRNT